LAEKSNILVKFRIRFLFKDFLVSGGKLYFKILMKQKTAFCGIRNGAYPSWINNLRVSSQEKKCGITFFLSQILTKKISKKKNCQNPKEMRFMISLQGPLLITNFSSSFFLQFRHLKSVDPILSRLRTIFFAVFTGTK